MSINKEHFVECSYDLYAGIGNERNMVEQATKESPMQYMHGIGMMIPAFEEKLNGLSMGDKFDFELTPDIAYGERRDDLVLSLDRQVFCNEEGEFDSENVIEGNMLPMMTADGQRVEGLVHEITSDKVVMDFNHPMAGMTLHFVGEILQEHPATEEDRKRIEAMMNPQEGCGCGCHDGGDASCGCHSGEEVSGGCCSSQGGCSCH